MLIEFRVKNFRSFRERQTLSMVGTTSHEHEKSNTFDSGFKGFNRLLRSAVIYGANAAGKTNLMRAVLFMKTFVLNSASTTGSAKYPYSPFKLSKRALGEPSEFEITFVQNGTRYEYGFRMGPERIEDESLIEHVQSQSRIRGRMLFSRSFDKRTKKYAWKFGPSFKGQRRTWRDSTRDDALFLSTATQLNSPQTRPVFEWFQNKLHVIVGAITLNESLSLKMFDEPNGKERLLPFLREADLGIVDLDIRKEPIPLGGGVVLQGHAMLEQKQGSPTPSLVKVTLSHMSDDPKQPVGFAFEEESSGTQILFKTAGAWLNVLRNGEVLLFDEIDTNMHPKLLIFLIQKFNSQATNSQNAQLICSTHNTSLLNQQILRRDQFWFVEKLQTGASKLYPLTDFSPRNDELIERWYMRGRYGALPILPEIPE